MEIVSRVFELVTDLPGEEDVAPEKIRKTMKVIITADALKIAGDYVTNTAFPYRLNPSAGQT